MVLSSIGVCRTLAPRGLRVCASGRRMLRGKGMHISRLSAREGGRTSSLADLMSPYLYECAGSWLRFGVGDETRGMAY